MDTGSAKESNVVHSRLKTELMGSAPISILILYTSTGLVQRFSRYVVPGSASVSVPPNSHFIKDIFNERPDWVGVQILPIYLIVIKVKATWNTTEEKEILRFSRKVLASVLVPPGFLLFQYRHRSERNKRRKKRR